MSTFAQFLPIRPVAKALGISVLVMAFAMLILMLLDAAAQHEAEAQVATPADIAVYAAQDNFAPVAGQTVTFRGRVRNIATYDPDGSKGPQAPVANGPAENVEFILTIPDSYGNIQLKTLYGQGMTCRIEGNNVICNDPLLGPGQSDTVTVTAEALQTPDGRAVATIIGTTTSPERTTENNGPKRATSTLP